MSSIPPDPSGRTLRTRPLRHGGAIVEVDLDGAVLDVDAAWLIEALQRLGEDAPLLPGQTIQVGWLELRLEARPSGAMGVSEPALDGSLPARWRPGAGQVLRHLRMQRDVCDSLALEPSFPRWTQSAIACDRLWATGAAGGSLTLAREAEAGADSGWFLGCASPGHDHQSVAALARESLYMLACRASAIVPYLALPPGTTVRVEPGCGPVFQHAGRTLELRPGSLLDALRR